jgi:hypothetical protein
MDSHYCFANVCSGLTSEDTRYILTKADAILCVVSTVFFQAKLYRTV